MKDELVAWLHQLKGKVCWGIVAGEPTGSIMTLAFGRKFPRRHPIRNPHLTDDQQRFHGELSLMIWCAWRLTTEERVLCTWNDPNGEGGTMLRALDLLINQTVLAVSVFPPTYDLVLEFTHGIRLSVFCDQSDEPPDDASDDYVLFVNGDALAYGVGPKGHISKEQESDETHDNTA